MIQNLSSCVEGSEKCEALLRSPSSRQVLVTNLKTHSVLFWTYKHPLLNPCPCAPCDHPTAGVLTTPFHFVKCSCWMYSLCIWKPLRKLWYLERAGRSVRISRRAVERPLVGVNMHVAISYGFSGKSGCSSRDTWHK